jgi:hypothetical protein
MQEIAIKLWCDRHWRASGEKAEATEARQMEYGRRRGRWDLCADCAAELDALAAGWLKSAQGEDARPTATAGFRPGSRESRNFYAGLRKWADAQGRTEEYMVKHRPGTVSGKVNYRYDLLIEDYEEYLVSRAAA